MVDSSTAKGRSMDERTNADFGPFYWPLSGSRDASPLLSRPVRFLHILGLFHQVYGDGVPSSTPFHRH
jgi:hypothetical protein